MPYQATTYNVMIASPGDVAAERAAVRQILADWNVIHSQSRRIVLQPLGWVTRVRIWESRRRRSSTNSLWSVVIC